ncbi:MAG: alpha/beta hydrolase [Treponema sp.]|nr:alpha/beta hydrolase [Treponema sp.]
MLWGGVLGIAGILTAAVLYGPVLLLNLIIGRRPFLFCGGSWLASQEPETVSLRSRDGLMLKAFYVSAPGSPFTAILAHGYRGGHQEVDAYARFFHDTLGYNVLLPDARAHGASEGTYIGFGWLERLDYLDWIGLVKQRGGGSGIVLFGVSMGAATVMMTAGEADLPPEVKAVVADCGYTSAAEEILHVLNRRRRPLARKLTALAGSLAKRRAGYSFEEASSLNQVKKARVPILFIHGAEDTFVPTRMVYSLYEACPAEKDILVVQGAGHVQSYSMDPETYERRVAAFLEKYTGAPCRFRDGLRAQELP